MAYSNKEDKYKKEREWSLKNADKKRAYRVKWRKKNKQKEAKAQLIRSKKRLKLLAEAPGGNFFSTENQAKYEQRCSVYDYKCYYCADPMKTLDHLIPISRGGTNWPSNILPACDVCNRAKGAKKLYFEWLP